MTQSISESNIKSSYQQQAQAFMPCTPTSPHHHLSCTHTVIAGSGSPCGENCSVQGHASPFLCEMCVIQAADPGAYDPETYSTDLRYFLVDMGGRAEAVREEVARLLSQGYRDSDLAREADWLGTFFQAHPEARQDENPEKPKEKHRRGEGLWQLADIQWTLDKAEKGSKRSGQKG